MGTLRDRVSTSVTRGADMHGVLLKSFILSVSAALLTLPYFYYLTSVISDKGHFTKDIGSSELIFTQLLLLFILCFLSSIIGLSFSKRYDLPDFGDTGDFVRTIPILFALALLIITLSFFLFDRYFYGISPASYPNDLLCLISLPFKGALAEELILRLCLVTLGVGLFRNKTAGVLLVSVVASIFSLKYFNIMTDNRVAHIKKLPSLFIGR